MQQPSKYVLGHTASNETGLAAGQDQLLLLEEAVTW
jgi:hypothetical protein